MEVRHKCSKRKGGVKTKDGYNNLGVLKAGIVEIAYHMGGKDGLGEKKYRKARKKMWNSEMKA